MLELELSNAEMEQGISLARRRRNNREMRNLARDELLAQPLRRLNVPHRAISPLGWRGLSSIGDLVSFVDINDLLSTDKFGPSLAAMVAEALRSYDLAFAFEDDPKQKASLDRLVGVMQHQRKLRES